VGHGLARRFVGGAVGESRVMAPSDSCCRSARFDKLTFVSFSDQTIARIPTLRLIDTDHAVDTEFVLGPATVVTPGLLGQRPLDFAVFGQVVEDFREPGFVPAASATATFSPALAG